jgi:hypothetical protein
MRFVGLYLITIVALAGCKQDEEIMQPLSAEKTPRLNIQLSHHYNGVPLRFNQAYPDSVNGSLSVTTFKYYFTNIILLDSLLGEIQLPDTYFLVDESIASSKLLKLPINSGRFYGIRFLIGVDAARNTSGVQSGPLDPKLGMFWTWVSGYIHSKMEGNYTDIQGSDEFIHHIGGFIEPYNTVRQVEITFAQALTVSKQQNISIQIEADLSKWFNSIHPIILRQTPVIIDISEEGRIVSENYQTMFTLKAVEVN